MKKVLIVGNSPSVKGGITTVINQFKNYDFSSNNIKTKFVSTYKDKNNFIKIMIFIVALIRVFFCFLFWKPNIIHIHMSYKGSFNRAYILQKMALIFHVKNVIHLHGSEFKKWYDSVPNSKKEQIVKLLNKSDKFIVLGDIWNQTIKEIEPRTDILILKNSVKIPKNKTKYDVNKKVISFLGVLIKRKGVADLISSLKDIDCNGYKIIIAGVGPEEENLKELVDKYQISNIEFVGWINENEKEKILLNSNFTILPSYNEGMPMSILESMSYGTPVLATNVGDIPTVISNDLNGLLYEPGDLKQLTKKLKKILNMNEKTWDEMSRNARSTIEEEFSEENYFEKIIVLYNELCR